MAKERIDLRKELLNYKYEFDLIQKIPYTKEQNKAFQQIIKNCVVFFTVLTILGIVATLYLLLIS